jgi:hypothetical protein
MIFVPGESASSVEIVAIHPQDLQAASATLAISAPKHHLSPMTPFLIFRCPNTNRQCGCDVATDAANLAKV